LTHEKAAVVLCRKDMQMPDFPLIDAHVHLWNPAHFRISWLDGDDLLNQCYTLPEYYEHTKSIAVEAMVYIEVNVNPGYALLEARWAAERAEDDLRLQGIVAWAPLEDGDQVRSYLDALVKIDPRIKGVRRIVQSEPDHNFCIRPAFIRGTQLLASYGLSCDICINYRQLSSAIKLVQQCPDTAFMLDHIAKPDIKAYMIEPWRQQISELASFPNVFCKVSGLVTEADHLQWQADSLAPYIEHVLATFGEDRVVFGGDWPVVLHASSYKRWVETLDQLSAHLSDEAKHKLWAENARRFYRLREY
jgi:L-fuconolactonase